MKILILGAGKVGSSLAEMLVSDDKSDVTVVDTHTEALDNLQERFDLRTVAGTAIIEVLKDTGIEDVDMMVAVTADDEVNLVACKIAFKVFNVPQRIARTRSTQWLNNIELLSEDGFAVDKLLARNLCN